MTNKSFKDYLIRTKDAEYGMKGPYFLGNANLNLNATGISNVGKIRLDMASGDRAVNLPGLDTLFNGIFLLRVFVC